MGTSGALAAKQMSFEFLRECLRRQWWRPQVNGEAVPCGWARHGEVSPTDRGSSTWHDECPAVGRPQLPPADDRWNGSAHIGQVGWRHLNVIMANLKLIRWRTGSQWSWRSTGVMWSNFRVPVTTRAAAFWTVCSFVSRPSLIPYRRLLQ